MISKNIAIKKFQMSEKNHFWKKDLIANIGKNEMLIKIKDLLIV